MLSTELVRGQVHLSAGRNTYSVTNQVAMSGTGGCPRACAHLLPGQCLGCPAWQLTRSRHTPGWQNHAAAGRSVPAAVAAGAISSGCLSHADTKVSQPCTRCQVLTGVFTTGSQKCSLGAPCSYAVAAMDIKPTLAAVTYDHAAAAPPVVPQDTRTLSYPPLPQLLLQLQEAGSWGGPMAMHLVRVLQVREVRWNSAHDWTGGTLLVRPTDIPWCTPAGASEPYPSCGGRCVLVMNGQVLPSTSWKALPGCAAAGLADRGRPHAPV